MLTVFDFIVPPFARVPLPDSALPYIAIEIVVEPPAEFVTVADVAPVPELLTVFEVLY